MIEWAASLMGERPTGMCPHCGEIVAIVDGLTAYHDWPKPTRQICPGSKQIHRCAESDARPLWNGEPNPHFAGGESGRISEPVPCEECGETSADTEAWFNGRTLMRLCTPCWEWWKAHGLIEPRDEGRGGVNENGV